MPDESQPSPGQTAPRQRRLTYLLLAVGLLAVVSAQAPTEAWRALLAWAGFGAPQTRRKVDGLDFPMASPPEDDNTGIGPIRVAVGDVVPDLALEDLDGRQVRLAQRRDIPVVIELSSATCAICLSGLRSMRQFAEHYAGQADFYFVYCREAHLPATTDGMYMQGDRPRRQAANAAERRQGATLVRVRIEPARWLLLDGFGKESLYEPLFGGSGADDPMIVVGTDGRVALVSRWADANEIEAYLNALPQHMQ
jgi:hypothetical protein